MLPKKDPSSSTNNHNVIKQKVLANEIRVAQISSYCALIVTGISTAIGFYGIVLVLQGQVTNGTLTSIGSFLATNGFIKIAAAANRRVDRLLKDD
jgi:RNA-binding protein YhbY